MAQKSVDMFFASPWRLRYLQVYLESVVWTSVSDTAKFYERYLLGALTSIGAIVLAIMAGSVLATVFWSLGLVTLGLAYSVKKNRWRIGALSSFVILGMLGQIFLFSSPWAIISTGLLAWAALSFLVAGIQNYYHNQLERCFQQEVVPASIAEDWSFWRHVFIRLAVWVFFALSWATLSAPFLSVIFTGIFIASLARYGLELLSSEEPYDPKWTNFLAKHPKLAPLDWMLQTLASFGTILVAIGGGLLLSGVSALVSLGWPILLIGSGYIISDRLLTPAFEKMLAKKTLHNYLGNVLTGCLICVTAVFMTEQLMVPLVSMIAPMTILILIAAGGQLWLAPKIAQASEGLAVCPDVPGLLFHCAEPVPQSASIEVDQAPPPSSEIPKASIKEVRTIEEQEIKKQDTGNNVEPSFVTRNKKNNGKLSDNPLAGAQNKWQKYGRSRKLGESEKPAEISASVS